MKDISSRLLSAACSGLVFISCFSGCSGLEQRQGRLRTEIQQEQRRAMTMKEWQDETLLYSARLEKGIIQPPLVTIEKKSGKCGDFAILSAFYSGERYGNNLLVFEGYNEKTQANVTHAVHLLEENRKYGCRGRFNWDTLPIAYGSKEDMIREIQKRRREVKYQRYWVINLDSMKKDWRTTRENLVTSYFALGKNGKLEIVLLPDTK